MRLGFWSMLALMLIGLKLAGFIAWSWWLVLFLPVVGFVVWLALLLALVVLAAIRE